MRCKEGSRLVMITKRGTRVTLSISRETKGLLDSIKHTGQSYNGLIQELVMLWEKQHAVKESLQGRSERTRERANEAKI